MAVIRSQTLRGRLRQRNAKVIAAVPGVGVKAENVKISILYTRLGTVIRDRDRDYFA